ncbi:acyl-CoA carboxylase subunit epsilon [Thalassiella azotivora]
MSDHENAADTARPALRVVHGAPTAEEVAALVCVLAATGGATGSADAGPTSAWTHRELALRGTVSPGPGAWRASALPR